MNSVPSRQRRILHTLDRIHRRVFALHRQQPFDLPGRGHNASAGVTACWESLTGVWVRPPIRGLVQR